jgi:hypothetical protein
MMLPMKPPCGFFARRDLKRGFVFQPIDQPFGEIPSGGNQEGWKKSLREVSAYSTVCPEFA